MRFFLLQSRNVAVVPVDLAFQSIFVWSWMEAFEAERKWHFRSNFALKSIPSRIDLIVIRFVSGSYPLFVISEMGCAWDYFGILADSFRIGGSLPSDSRSRSRWLAGDSIPLGLPWDFERFLVMLFICVAIEGYHWNSLEFLNHHFF